MLDDIHPWQKENCHQALWFKDKSFGNMTYTTTQVQSLNRSKCCLTTQHLSQDTGHQERHYSSPGSKPPNHTHSQMAVSLVIAILISQKRLAHTMITYTERWWQKFCTSLDSLHADLFVIAGEEVFCTVTHKLSQRVAFKVKAAQCLQSQCGGSHICQVLREICAWSWNRKKNHESISGIYLQVSD